jgi:opacity protein-like surface antigen
MKKIFAIAASALVLAAPAISAQEEGPSAEAAIAYTAINSSTVGAVPLATNTLAPAGGMSWHLQYGRLTWDEDVSQSMYAGGLNLSAGQGRLGISAGYVTFDCEDCDGHLTVGTRYGVQLTGGALGDARSGSRWAVGLEGELGFAFPEDVSVMAGAAHLPIKVTMGKNVKVSPFLTPGFAYGRMSAEDESESGTRFMVGGGLGLQFANGIGANFGLRKVFIEQGETQFGLGFTIRPGSK